MPGREPFRLPPRDPALYFIQRLRDEAHRSRHRHASGEAKREMTKNPLDEIAGIGPSRKRARCSCISARPKPFHAPRLTT